jgi:cell division protein FtsA
MAKRIISALDVGSTKITAIIASFDDETGKPRVIGWATIPSAGIKKGVVVNIDEATAAIDECVQKSERMAGLTVSSVYVNIGGRHIESLNNKGVVAVSGDGDITFADVERAIEGAKTISLPPSREIIGVFAREFIVDSEGGIMDPIGMSGSRLEVDTHIVHATETAIRNLFKCIRQNGLGIDDVVFSGWAASEAVLTDTEKELGVTLLDIGGGTTDVSVYSEEALGFSGSVPLAGLNITSDLAIGLKISLEDAERLKLMLGTLLKKHGSNDEAKSMLDENIPALHRRVEDPEKKKEKEADSKKSKDMLDVSDLGIEGKTEISLKLLNEIVDARLEEILDMVRGQVKQSGFDVAMPAGIIVTGGSAMLPGITEIIEKKFNSPVRIGYPAGLAGMVEEISTPDYAVAQGLILYDIIHGGTSQYAGSQSGGEGGGIGGVFTKARDWIKSLLP